MTRPRTAVRRLALARVISVTGSAAAYTALMFEIYDQTESSVWLAASLLVTEGVSGLVGPFASVLGDRFDRRTVMIVSDLAAAACFAGMAMVASPRGRWWRSLPVGAVGGAVLAGLERGDPEPGS
jgi:MFS family permease